MSARIILLVMTGLAIPLSFVSAPYPTELVLQHVPTVLGIGLLAGATVGFQPSRISFGCCLGFVWLHLIGARWIYSFVPYDELAHWISGRTLSDVFGWQRNHYDRGVHLASGLLGVPPISEVLQRQLGSRPLASCFLAVGGVLAIGAVYEILEWQIAITFSPQMAEAYNGQQGDVWDAQKDLALAGLGAVVSTAFFFRWNPAGPPLRKPE